MEKGRVVILLQEPAILIFYRYRCSAAGFRNRREVILWPNGALTASMMPIPDPSDARRYDTISYLDVISQNLGVMDTTATSLCMDNGIPIIVFNFDEKAASARQFAVTKSAHM